MGKRGEGWVIGQFVIGIAVAASALVTRIEVPLAVRLFGVVLMGIGGLLVAAGALHLGENLSVMPKPKEQGHSLVTSGVYGFVRHPIYAGVILGAFGWSLFWGTLLGVALSVALFVWLDLKSRREEKWLSEKYPEYPAYQARVKKLVPFIY